MANVAHASLTGAELHEPKGADTADAGTVYVADGNGSGSWSSVGTSSFTGAIAAFGTPTVPDGWLELDGSDINTTTYAGLYAAYTIQQTGTRTSGSAVISGLSSTTHMRVGYYVFGTGITSGTTILSIDSSTQITLSANAGSSGSATVVVSPWLLNTGTIRLPNMTASGRFPRSRTGTVHIGTAQADQNQAHTHVSSGTTSTESTTHQHSFSGTTSADDRDHSHGYRAYSGAGPAAFGTDFYAVASNTLYTENSGGVSQGHYHTYGGTTTTQNTNHTHSWFGTSSSSGGTEARPLALVLMWCVKT